MIEGEAILRGFDMTVSDVGDQLHFRQPLLSFGTSSKLYVAGRVDWHGDKLALTKVDDPEDLEMATLLTDGVGRRVTSGKGVVVAGAAFFQAASRAGFQLGGFSCLSAEDDECWIRVATAEEFVALKGELIDESREVFDEELGEARRQGSRLTKRGNAAMLILRRCGPLHREDLAIRQLAAARQNRDLDLYRRLLARFELELDEPEDRLHKQADRHIELADAEVRAGWHGSAGSPEAQSVRAVEAAVMEAQAQVESARAHAESTAKEVQAKVEWVRAQAEAAAMEAQAQADAAKQQAKEVDAVLGSHRQALQALVAKLQAQLDFVRRKREATLSDP